MKAAMFQDGRVTMVERERPAPGPGEALVRVLRAGVCATDLELVKGYMGFSGVAGHEFVGRVEAAPDHPEHVGARVAADINRGCGTCLPCLGGDPRHCRTRTVMGIAGWDGAFAEYLVAPVAGLHLVPDAVSDAAAAMAELLAAALEPSQQLALTARARLLILGDGRLGLLSALALRHHVPGLVLAGRHAEKLAIAARAGVTARAADEVAGSGERFDVVIEATGRPDGLALALALTRPEGTIVAKTTVCEPSALDLARLVVDEISLVGSRCGDMALAVHYLKEKLVDVRPLIEAEYPFARFPEALAHAGRKGALKVQVVMP